MSLSYSPLAWELAQHAKLRPAVDIDGPPVVAQLATFTLLGPVAGRGNTITEAMRELARELDRIAERMQPRNSTSSEGSGK